MAKKEDGKTISDEERERRAEVVKQAFAISRLEGYEPSDETKNKAQLFIDGEIEAYELI